MAVRNHLSRYAQWKQRCDVLMLLSRVDKNYRSEVERKVFFLGSAASDAFKVNVFTSQLRMLVITLVFHISEKGGKRMDLSLVEKG